MHSRKALQNYGRTERSGHLSTPMSSPRGVAGINVTLQAYFRNSTSDFSAPRWRGDPDRSVSIPLSLLGNPSESFHRRSEKRVETDTASNPSTTERVGDEHHNDPLLGHFGGPDTPLFRVSTSVSLARLIHLTLALSLDQAGLFLLLFGVTLVVYLWDLDVSAAGVTLVVISIGLAFCACIPIGNQPATPYRSRETGDSRAIVHRGRMEGCSVCDRTGCPAYKEKA